MAVLGAQSVRKSFADREVLCGVSVTVAAGERLGLVGINGSGKTTLARILAGTETADDGEVTRGRGIGLAYLAQTPDMDPSRTALEVALSGLTAWTEAVARHEALSAKLAEPTAKIDAVLAAQERAAAEVERLGGWDLTHQAEAMLGHLGIASPAQTVGTMSGGERRRVAMARLLVSRPDVAILDEPTNHLDIPTIEWLERFLLERFTGALLLITHDRYLLDRVVTRTLEMDHGTLHSYDGGWGAYLAARAERQAHTERVESNRRNFLRRELEWLRRQPKARTTKQKARIGRAHDAMDVDGPAQDKAARIAIGGVRSGKTVLDVRGIAVEIGGKRLVDSLTLSLGVGERIGIIGPNGAGKTTLLRVLIGDLEPAAGTVVIGKNTRFAYLNQSRAGLDDHETVLANIGEGQGEVTLGENTMSMRSYCERFLFDSAARRQLVGTLSGGERARVALARVLRQGANVVILDEPTNDLDVTTLAALEESLIEFAGTTLVVTHDRWFLDRVATSILAFEGDGRVVHVHGNYADYQGWRAQDEAERAAEQATPSSSHDVSRVESSAAISTTIAPAPRSEKPLTYGEEIELEGMMERIDEAEARVAELDAVVAAAEFSRRDYADQAAVLDELAAAREEADALVERWSDLEGRAG